MESKIGQIIAIESRAYDFVIAHWQKPLAILQEVIESYKSLPDLLGPFTQETYLDVAYNHGKKTFAAFTKAIEIDTDKRIGSLAAKILLNTDISKLYHPLQKLIVDFHRSMEPTFNLMLSYDDVEIKNGSPFLLTDKILRRYRYTLDNGTQAKMYDLLLKATEAYNIANAFLLTIATPFDLPMLQGTYGLLYEDKNGFLDINHGNINRLKEEAEILNYTN